MYKNIKTYFRHLVLQNKLKKKKDNVINYSFGNNNILIIDENIPEFDKDSGSKRMYEIIKILVKNNFNVFLLCSKKEYKFNYEYVNHFENLGVTVYKPHLLNNKLVTKNDFLKNVVPKLKWAILSRPDIYQTFYKQIRSLNSNCALIYDMVDFHSIRFLREYELNHSEIALKEANKYMAIEKFNCLDAEITLAVSNKDKEYLTESSIAPKSLSVISNIHQPSLLSTNDFQNREDLLFIGGFKHAPNIDAVKILHDKIMPLVWEKLPHIKINIVGSHVPEEIKKLHSNNFIIHGFVEDVSIFFNSCRLFVAPLQYGAGIKGKIGQSFEYNLPVVTTSIGLEGFNFSPYEEHMVGSINDDYVDKIVNLYSNEKLWNDIKQNCKLILEPFSVEATEKTLLRILK